MAPLIPARRRGDTPRVLALVVVLACVVAVVSAVSLGFLYHVALREQGELLRDVLRTRVATIEADLRLRGSPETTLELLRDASASSGIGQTGEFTLARREGEWVVWLVSHGKGRRSGEVPGAIRAHGGVAGPMKRALRGESGTMIGLDYAGTTVLAAYQPVAEVGWGLVAKIDLAEIRAPFFRAAGLSAAAAALAIALGAVVFLRVTNPMIRRLEETEKNLQQSARLLDLLAAARLLIVREKDRHRLLDQACRLAVEKGGLRMAWIGFVEPGSGVIRPAAVAGAVDGYLDDIEITVDPEKPSGRGPMGRAVRENRPVFFQDVRTDPGFEPWRAPALRRRYFSAGAFPIVVNGSIRGALGAYAGEPGFFVAETVDLLRDLADDISFALAAIAAEETQHRLVSILDSTTDFVGTADIDGRMLYLNDSGRRRLLGLGPGDPLPSRRIADLHPPWAAERIFTQGIPAAIVRGSWAGDTAFLDSEGREIPVSQVIISHYRADGAIGFLSTVARDITDRRRMEEEVRRLNVELEERVEQRTAELAAANRELEAFSYAVAHDLRAPLRAIDGFGKVLLEDYGERLDSAGRHCIDRVRHAAGTMAWLIDALLTLSRLSRRPMVRRAVDLAAETRAILDRLEDLEPGRGVEVVISEPLVAEGDPGLLRSLLANLLENAWKFTRDAVDARIEVGVEKHAGTPPVYFVRDNGAGFDMRYVDKLFQPFERLHVETRFGGMGIGLATVQRVVARHGGRVWAEGRVGAGATFRFTLAPGPASGDGSGADRRGSGETAAHGKETRA